MREFFVSIWRQRTKYLLLFTSIVIGAVTICTVCVISDLGTQLMDKELDAMGLNGLIVTSPAAAIQKEDADTIAAQSYIRQETPLCYESCTAEIAGETRKVLLWGIDERTYQTVSLTLLHGRLLSDADAKTDCGMVDAAFARALYGRENIVGKTVTVKLSHMPVSFTVVGVVDTGGALTGQLMGDVVPCFLYLPMQTLSMYSGSTGYNQLMLKLTADIDAEDAASRLISCFAHPDDSIEIQNMAGKRDQLSGILDVFRLVLSAFGGISFLTCGISMMTVMLQNVREQLGEIGIKKALGATDARIGFEYFGQAVLLSVAGSAAGCLVTLLLVMSGCALLSIEVQLSASMIWMPSLPGIIIGSLFGLYPALKAAKCPPVTALSAL